MNDDTDTHSPDCDCWECKDETEYTKAGHLRELPELLQHVTLEDMRILYPDGEYGVNY